MKKLSRISALVLSLMLVLSACGGSGTTKSSVTAASGGQSVKSVKDNMVIGLTEEPGALDPTHSTLSSNGQVGSNIYDTLFVKDPATGKDLPSLATSYKKIDDLTYQISIRKDVTFHNGEKLTANDVLFTITRLTTASATKSRYTAIDAKNCKMIDDYTVELKLKSPWANVITYFTGSLSCVVCKKVAEDPNSKMERNPVGTGPYKFVSWTTGDSIVLEANDKYWNGKPVTKKLTFKFFPDASIRAIQLEAGDVDFIYSVGGQDYERLSKDKNTTVVSGVGFTFESLYFNQKLQSVYSDVRVRKALTYALDMPSVVKAVWGDLAVPADSIYPTALMGHVAIGPVKRDVEAAKKLLAEAGYPNGLDCEMTVPNSSETLQYLEIMQNQWADAGIRMKINSLDQATVKELNATGKNPLGRSNFTASTGDPIHALAAWQIGYVGVMCASDTKVDDLINKAREASDQTKAVQYLEEIQRYALQEKYYAIPVAFTKSVYAMKSKMFGFIYSPYGNSDFSKIGVYAN